MFKPCVSPLYLDQMRSTQPIVRTEKSGERVIVDTDATTESAVLWFYGFINIGALMGIPASYSEKYVGWSLTFGLPLAIWVFLPAVLFWVRPRLVLHPPGGSDLGRCCKVVAMCLRRGWKRIGRHGFWDAAKPSFIAASGSDVVVPWNDDFVEDVRRTFQACGMFCFFPIQAINDNGLGSAADGINTMLTSNGVPNDFLQNFNSILIIIAAPILNYALYPLLRKWHIRYGPVARITTGLLLAAIGGTGYTVLNYYAYKLGPCGKYGSSITCVDANGVSLFAPITVWWIAIPYAIGGLSELFVNVPAYGIAYSRAPVNMRGLVSALNLLTQGVTYALGLAFSGLVRDPYLTWVFGAPAIIGYVAAVVFWFLFNHIDKEEYTLSKNDGRTQDTSSSVSLEPTGPEKKAVEA
jgi:dipeptide/tripeptide permease